jgi:hypothetical protein
VAVVATESKSAIVAEAIQEAGASLAGWRTAIVAAAVLGAALQVVAALWTARRGRPVANSTLAGAALLFVVGLAGFVATRGHAHDAALPVIPGGDFAVPDLARAPLIHGCARGANLDLAPTGLPVIDLHQGSLKIDWRTVEPRELRELLAARRETTRLIHPDAKPPEALGLLLADANDPAPALAPVLRALDKVAAPGSPGLALAARDERVLDTRTLGRLHFDVACVLPLEIASSGIPLARFTTVDHLAQTLARARAPLAIAP